MLKPNFTVLLVDDSVEDRVFWRRCLKQDKEHRYTILEAATGAAGLECCQQVHPDVILLDYLLPDLDGLEFLKRCHQQLESPLEQPIPPVVVVTGQGNTAAAVQVMKYGAKDYLVKQDLNAELLQITVCNVLKQSQLQQQLTQQQSTIAHQFQIQQSLQENQFCLRLINAITSDRSLDLTGDQVIERILRQIHHFYASLSVRYCVLDPHDRLKTQVLLHPPALANCTGMEFDLGQLPGYQTTLRAGQPWVTADIFQEPRLVSMVERLQQSSIRAMLTIPLKHSETELGLLSLTCDRKRDWSAREVQTLTEIADFLAFALQAARNREQQQLAEAALHQSEANLKEAQRVAQIGSWECEMPTQVITWSEALYRMFGLDSSQPAPSYAEYLEKVHPDDRPNLLQGLEQAIHHKTPYVIDYRVILPDGSIRYQEGRVEVVPNAAGQVIKLFGTVLDITDRKQTERALQKTTEELNCFFSVALDLLCIATTEGYFLRLNPAWEKVLGYPVKEMENQRFLDLVHPDDLPRTLAALATLAEQHEILDFVNRYRHQDGSYRWVEWRSIPVGNLIYAAARDITERKQAELKLQQLNEELEQRVEQRTQELRRSQVALQENEARLRLALMAANEGLYDLNLQTGAAIVTSEYATMLGYDPATFHETNAKWIERLHPDDVERVRQVYQSYVRGDLPDYKVEFRQRTQNGEWKWILSLGKIVEWNADGQPVRMLGTHTDIDDRKAAEAALQQINLELESRVEQRTADLKQAKEAAEAANQAKSLFLANMSHELRTPLTAILGFSELLTHNASLPAAQQAQIKIINRSGEHLLSLINDILDMSRTEAGKAKFEPNSFELNSFLESLRQLFASRAESKGLQLVVVLDANLPRYIHTDEKKLRQILINLLSNAVKFTSRGRVTLKVKNEAIRNKKIENKKLELQDGVETPKGESLLLNSTFAKLLIFEVIDTGIGIATNELDTIFEAFVQSSQSNKNQVEGTGLGLSISRQFARLLGGELSVTSELGQGSTFRFAMPIAQGETPPLAVPPLEKRAIAIAPGQILYRILLVEDNWTNCQLLLSLLQPLGFQLKIAANGQEAVALWETWQPQLILMDLRMPVMDGYEATRCIRAREQEIGSREPDMPPDPSLPPLIPTKIIALTTGAFAEDRAKALAIGCDDFVCKPLQKAVLLKKMTEHLDVQFVYAEEHVSQQSPKAIQPAIFSLQPSALQVMPGAWISQLYQATTQLNSAKMLVLIEQIPAEHAVLAQTLREKVNDFDFEQIMKLAQAAMQ